jgi:hypothetical protein
MLIDRPLHSFATVGGTAALTTATNFNTPNGAGCVLLVNCSSNDGAVIDSISAVINEASTTTTSVLVFISTATSTSTISAANTACVANVAIPAGTTVGQRINVSLPPLSVPVPNLASPAATTVGYPTETDKKNTGLYVPSSALIYVGTASQITAPSATTRVNVFAQGGFF